MADIARHSRMERGDDTVADMLFWAKAARRAIESHRRDLGRVAAAGRRSTSALAALEATARAMALAMEFGFLLDHERKLLSIGYRVTEGTLDPTAMICSLPRRGSRVSLRSPRATFRPATGSASAAPSTPVAQGAALISWSGSMFEYLMPSLVMRAPADSLLEHTNRLIVRRQIDYGAGARACPGAFRNRPTMRAISNSPINIRTSAFLASA